jgi:hypothetical protein
MKRLLWALLFVATATPTWAAKKTTVAQLQEMLQTMQHDRKSDPDVATALKQIELSEQLTRSAMNTLMHFVPGPRSTEQIYVLEARSANLIPPLLLYPTQRHSRQFSTKRRSTRQTRLSDCPP